MTTIDRHGPHATLINVFTVEPRQASELAALLDDATEKVMRVVNYAQWESADAYQAMLVDPVAREHMGRAAALATGFDPHLYTVESVHGR